MLESVLLLLLGSLASAFIAFLGWLSVAIIRAGKSIAVLENLLKDISGHLKKIAEHETSIALIENKLEDMREDIVTLFHRKVSDDSNK